VNTDENPKDLKVRSELTLRVISAVVLLAILLPLIWLGGWSFSAMCLALSAVLFFEWYQILRKHDDVAIWWWPAGVIYAAIPIFCFPLIRDQTQPDGLLLILFLFLVVVVTDVAAYFAGRAIGGPKLMPKVSPKKTWSGALGGLIVSMLAGMFFCSVFLPDLGFWALIAAAALSTFSQAGDLFESWFKRRFDVKDSSNLIPGHGGFMDRCDGLLLAAVPVVLYVVLTKTL